MDRSKKQQAVAELHDALQGAASVILAQHNGLTVSEANNLRAQAREVGVRFRFAKNTLAKIAVQGTPYAHLEQHFSGPIGIAYADEDVVAPAKIVIDYAKKNEKLSPVAGGMGETALSAADVKALAALPSLDSLRGTLVGLILAPATKIAGVTQAPAGQLARVFGAYANKV
ncbi:MAG: 50S ribosomal protein L10 [Pseudomonadota bacterium]